MAAPACLRAWLGEHSVYAQFTHIDSAFALFRVLSIRIPRIVSSFPLRFFALFIVFRFAATRFHTFALKKFTNSRWCTSV